MCGVGDSSSGNSDREQHHPGPDGADLAQHHGVTRPVTEQQRANDQHGGEDRADHRPAREGGLGATGPT